MSATDRLYKIRTRNCLYGSLKCDYTPNDEWCSRQCHTRSHFTPKLHYSRWERL